MVDEKKEKWMNYMAITTVLIAVCATFSTFRGGGYGTKSLMNQTQASDKWAEYEAKSIKSYIYGMQKDNFEIQKEMITQTASNKAMIDKYQEKIDGYNKKLKQYEQDKADIMNEAKAFEAAKANCTLHSGAFGIAVIFLQISILLSSISALAKKRYIYLFSLIVGAVGVVYFFDGFFLFIK